MNTKILAAALPVTLIAGIAIGLGTQPEPEVITKEVPGPTQKIEVVKEVPGPTVYVPETPTACVNAIFAHADFESNLLDSINAYLDGDVTLAVELAENGLDLQEKAMAASNECLDLQ